MAQPQELPSSHFSLQQTTTPAISRAWQLDVFLAGDRPIKFFGLIVLNDGPAENERIATELAQRIQDTIRYHQQLLVGHNVSLTQEDFFEQCLQKINSEINVFLRDVQAPLPVFSWSFVIAMVTPEVSGNRWQVFLSRFGDVSAWLLHKAQLDTYKLLTIFDTPDPITGTPGAQKYFKNIVSSSLSDQDQILLCTPNIFNYVSLSDMKRFLTELSVKSAMRQLQNVIQEHLIDPVAAALTIKLSPYRQTKAQSGMATPASAEESMQSLMDTQSQTEKLLGTSTAFGMGNVRALGQKMGASLNQALEKTSAQNRVLRSIVQTIKRAGASIQRLFSKILDKRANKTPMGKSEYVGIHGSVAKISWWQNTVRPYLAPLFVSLRRLLRLDRPDSMKQLARSPALYVTIAVFIVVALISSRLYTQKEAREASIAAAQATIDGVRDHIDRIDSYLIVGREADATQLAAQAKVSLEAIPQEFEQFQEPKTQLINKLEEQLRQLRKEIHVQNPTILLSDLETRLNAPAKFLARDGNSLLVVAQDPHTVLLFDVASSTPLSRSVSTDITSADAVARDGNTAVILSGNTVINVNLQNGTSSAAATTNSQNPIQALATYNSRVYGLVPAEQQIIRSNRAPNFSVFSPWLETPSPALAQAKDLVIDGSIYVLTDTGMAQYAQGSEVTGFKLDPVEPALSQALAMSYVAENNFFFILESKRLLVYRKNGKFLAQYLLENQPALLDLFVDEKTSFAYVLTSDQLLSFPVQLAP